MQDSRKMQELDKEKNIAEQVKQERDEFMRIITQQKLEREAERLLEEERKKILYEHARDLRYYSQLINRMQIAKNSEQKMQEKKDFGLEGDLLRGQQEEKLRKLERIKKEKLEEMERLGIPQKYRAELQMKKIG